MEKEKNTWKCAERRGAARGKGEGGRAVYKSMNLTLHFLCIIRGKTWVMCEL